MPAKPESGVASKLESISGVSSLMPAGVAGVLILTGREIAGGVVVVVIARSPEDSMYTELSRD